MPQLIRNFDAYFREKQRDLYFIRFRQAEDGDADLRSGNYHFYADDCSRNPPGREEIMAWLATNLPNTLVEPIFNFDDRSGILCAPYAGAISIDFDDDTLAIFCAHWEKPDGGSLDRRFQCYCYPFALYLEQNGGVIPAAPWDDPDWNP